MNAKKSLIRGAMLAICFAWIATSSAAAQTWSEIVEKAKGQTVYWNAWGGDERTNSFIAWVGQEVSARYGVHLKQVKLSDTAEAVARVRAEKAAGKTEGGSVDLIWINGPNFLTMKQEGLLFGPYVESLPNSRYLDLTPGSAASTDFTVPVEGFESPWRLAQFVFHYDAAKVAAPPLTMKELLDWSERNPGRFTHPDAQNFMGATFLKQSLVELATDKEALSQPVDEKTYGQITKPLWEWYDALKPNLWRKGTSFPANESVQQQLLNDGEIDIAMSFDPASAAAAIEKGMLPSTIKTYAPRPGSIGNISFVAIPFNSSHKEAAQLVANFLLAPETQARAQNIRHLGSYTVLDFGKLDADQRAFFDDLPKSPALPSKDDLGQPVLEPHATWMTRLVADWSSRYAK